MTEERRYCIYCRDIVPKRNTRQLCDRCLKKTEKREADRERDRELARKRRRNRARKGRL